VASFRFVTHVAAPPERVFDLWTDLPRMREWVGGVTDVTDISGPVARAGTTYTTWFGKMASQTAVIAAERPRLFHTRFGNRILKGENRTTIEPEGDGSRLVQEFRTEGLVSGFFARLFAMGSYRGSFQGELNAFVRIVEREAAAAR
jgi:uncharacterized protein YndB with AHSA1/START domain